MNLARFVGLAVHLLSLVLLFLKTPRIVNRDCHIAAQRLQKSKLRRRKSIVTARI